jgi:hypothetical protein
MRRAIPVLAGLAVVLGSGLVHGLWTQRWSKSADIAGAVGRLSRLPEDLEDWRAEPGAEDRESLTAAGAEGWWLRRYVHRHTGTQVEVLLLCGRSGRMCVHRPENCYSAAGFDLGAPPVHYRLPATTGEPAAL